MIELTISEADLTPLRTALLTGDVERCAILFASQVTRSDQVIRLLVREFALPADEDYTAQLSTQAVLRPDFVARVTKKARKENLGLVFVHTHLDNCPPRFSPVDSEGEQHLAAFLRHRHPDRTHAALVVSEGGFCARQLGTEHEIRVVSLGETRYVLFDPSSGTVQDAPTFDRQIRAFGETGQKILQGMRIGIVGLGGTGSIVAQQLAHLGVRQFILIDPDVVEPSNLNRLAGAAIQDVGAPKVSIAERYINTVVPDASVASITGDIIRAKIARNLVDADVIFGCTDSHGSRAVLQQISYQYLIPCIDMGSTITTAEGKVTGIFGRVQALTPITACFTCSGLLDPDEVRKDMMNAFERKLDPYLQGIREPAPSVISLNGTVASLAITMFMAYVTGLPSRARYLLYNAMNGTLRAAQSARQHNCYICSPVGTLARGDSQPLYARQD